MSSVESPSASSTTATGFPRYGVVVNTSTCWNLRCIVGLSLRGDLVRRVGWAGGKRERLRSTYLGEVNGGTGPQPRDAGRARRLHQLRSIRFESDDMSTQNNVAQSGA